MNYPYYDPYQTAPAQFAPQMPYNQRQSMAAQCYPQQQIAPQTQTGGQTAGFSPASRPVSSREEAMAVGADFSGLPMVFLDMAHDTVYVKQWDFNRGSAIFAEYSKASAGQSDAAPSPSWATQEEVKALADRLSRIEKKGAKNNDDE